jgi:hypothetical protein
LPAEAANSGAATDARPATLSLSGDDLAGLLGAVCDRHACFRFAARGISMHPFIRDGDVLTVAPLDGPVAVGDVVAVRDPRGQRLLVHRVVTALRGRFVVRGDNTREPDGAALQADVLGRVCRVERGGRRVRLGQGPERHLLAALSARGLLVPLVSLALRLRHCLRRGIS